MRRRTLVCFALVLGCLVPVAASAAGWQAIGPDGASLDGFAQAPSDPDVMYCLPQRLGVYRSNDRGANWQRVDTGLPFAASLQNVAVSPVDANLVLVSDPGSDAIQRSTDGGQTWLAIPVNANWTLSWVIAFDPTNPQRVLTKLGDGDYPGVHRSTDAGLTWVLSNTGIASPGVGPIAFHPTQTGVVVAGNWNGLYRSTDGGSSWSAAIGPSFGVNSISFCAGAPNRVWATTWSLENHVLRSDDAGLSFSTVTGTPPVDWDHSIPVVAAHPTDPNIVVGAYRESSCGGDCEYKLSGYVRSTNGGASWLPVIPVSAGGFSFESTRPIVAFDPANAATICLASNTSPGGLLRSENAGLSWQPRMQGIAGRSIGKLGRDAAGAIYFPGTWRSASVGAPWEQLQGAYATTFDVNRSSEGLLIGSADLCGVGCAFYSRSTDGGATWVSDEIPSSSWGYSTGAVSNNGATNTFYAWLGDTDVSPHGYGTLLSRSDDGVSFAATHFLSLNIRAAVIHPTDSMRLVAVGDDPREVWLTTDGGASWVPRTTGLPNQVALEIFMDPLNPDRLAVVYSFAGVYRSDDGGLTWSQVPLGVAPQHIGAADWDPVADRFALATANGVLLTGRGWLNAGLPTYSINSILFVPESGHLLVSTSGASVQAFDLSDASDAPVIVTEAKASDLLVSPNPSTGRVRFELAAPTAKPAVLEIYTVAGRRVVALASEVQGAASFLWDGRDAARVRVAPGVYFARVTVGTETRSSRFVRLDP